MHELSIANAILDAVHQEAEKHPGARVTKVAVRIGELAGIDPEALDFSFSALVKGSDLEPLALEIEPLPRRHRCRQCGETFAVSDARLACPSCGSAESVMVSGDEMELAYMEVEET